MSWSESQRRGWFLGVWSSKTYYLAQWTPSVKIRVKTLRLTGASFKAFPNVASEVMYCLRRVSEGLPALPLQASTSWAQRPCWEFLPRASCPVCSRGESVPSRLVTVRQRKSPLFISQRSRVPSGSNPLRKDPGSHSYNLLMPPRSWGMASTPQCRHSLRTPPFFLHQRPLTVNLPLRGRVHRHWITPPPPSPPIPQPHCHCSWP